MSPRSDRNADVGRRSRRSGGTGEAGQAAPLNLGCGTLLVLFLLVATAGKFLPHQTPERSPSVKPAMATSLAKGAKPMVGEAPPLAERAPKPPERAAVAAPRTVENATQAVKQPADAGPLAGGLDELAGRLQAWARDAAGSLSEPAPASGKGPPAAKAPSPTAPAMPSVRPPAGPGEAAARVATVPAEKSVNGAARGAKHPLAPVVRSRDPAEPLPGKAVVFNSPWDRSVEQVLRYLKRHTHDAESIEVLEWGAVKPTDRGYEVRCAYRSRNVLGHLATQNQLFVLDREGVVIDIRD